MPPVLTPRRSPRLAAKQLALSSACTAGPSIGTPVREALRESVRQREGRASLFDEVKTVVKSQYPKLEAIFVTAEAPSKLERYLLITRRLKVYDGDIGPHDAVQLTVAEDGQYKLMAYEKPRDAGQLGAVQSPSRLHHRTEPSLSLQPSPFFVSQQTRPSSFYRSLS